ncbi:MAG: DNA polymerase III subunit delta [Methylacidiphilales bacterium]|nr:DNA polymerase III subunit delta [Candidatus Methylacidiphilales bacterium]MDW8349660.1 DNA polymerase III subunit delta [Verrucomicrobiae bacterium]
MSRPRSSSSKIYFFAGSDHGKVQQAAQHFFDQLKIDDPMNVEILDGRILSKSGEEAVEVLKKTQESILTRSFFGGEKVVWLKNVNFMDDSPLARYESVQTALDHFVDFLSKASLDEVTLIISALGVDKRRSAYKHLSTLATTEIHDEPDPRKLSRFEIQKLISDILQEKGLQASEEVCEYLFIALGIDTHALQSAAEKLLLYIGPHRHQVTLADAREMVFGQREAVVWDFCNAVLAKRQADALDLLRQLLLQKESDIGILIILAQQLRTVTLCAALLEEKLMRLIPKGDFAQAILEPQAEIYLPKKKSGETISPFQLGSAARHAKRQPLRRWVESLERLYETYLQMLRGTIDKEEALQLLVIELCA